MSTRIFRGTPEAEAARRQHEASLAAPRRTRTLDAAELKAWCREFGADDVGIVEVGRAGLGADSDRARRLFSRVRSLVCFVTVSNPEAIRSDSRAVANMAWHQNHARSDEIADALVNRLAEHGVGAVSTSIGFPMESQPHDPNALPWEIQHKVIAVEAGLGHMGVHRNVIHPKFGNFVLIETVLIDAEVSEYDHPLDYNPCNGCNLCVVACPVGAVRANDDFDFFACLNHNYREFLFGFDDWITSIAAAGDADAYRSKFSYEETRSMWQSLGFGPNYKAAYCMAVCPAGDDVIGAYMADKQAWRREVVEPFKEKVEPIYVASGSRAERVARRNPNKRIRYIDYRVDVSTPDNFELGLRHRFEPRRATDIACSVAFEFPDGSLRVASVHDGGLHLDDPTDDAPDCLVRLAGDDYISVIHPTPEPGDADVPRYELVGDPAAFGALLACLD